MMMVSRVAVHIMRAHQYSVEAQFLLDPHNGLLRAAHVYKTRQVNKGTSHIHGAVERGAANELSSRQRMCAERARGPPNAHTHEHISNALVLIRTIM